MTSIIVRFQFSDFKANDLIDLLKKRYGGALNYVADGTLLIDTYDTPDEVYELISPIFTFDDKLFVGALQEFRSLHNVSRSKPSMHKIA